MEVFVRTFLLKVSAFLIFFVIFKKNSFSHIFAKQFSLAFHLPTNQTSTKLKHSSLIANHGKIFFALRKPKLCRSRFDCLLRLFYQINKRCWNFELHVVAVVVLFPFSVFINFCFFSRILFCRSLAFYPFKSKKSFTNIWGGNSGKLFYSIFSFFVEKKILKPYKVYISSLKKM